MAYGKTLGELVIARRGKPWSEGRRKKAGLRPIVKDCHAKDCYSPILEGQPHFVLLRTMKLKSGKVIWTTRKFHYGGSCFPNWLEYTLKLLEKREEKEWGRVKGRTPTVTLDTIPYNWQRVRLQMIKRRSYLTGRLYALKNQMKQYPEASGEVCDRSDVICGWSSIVKRYQNVELERETLQIKIEAIAPYAAFKTKKGLARFMERGDTEVGKAMERYKVEVERGILVFV